MRLIALLGLMLAGCVTGPKPCTLDSNGEVFCVGAGPAEPPVTAQALHGVGNAFQGMAEVQAASSRRPVNCTTIVSGPSAFTTCN